MFAKWIVACCLLAPLAAPAAQALPLPALPPGTIELRVAYVRNPRLPEMSEQQLQTVLRAAARSAEAHFRRAVQFSPVTTFTIAEVFGRVSPGLARKLDADVYDFKTGGGDLPRLRKSFEEDIRGWGDPLEALIRYTRPHLLVPLRARSFPALSDALLDTQLARLDAFRRERLADGRPLIDDAPYNEYVYWDAVDALEMPFEVILTNQLMASVEYRGASAHSAIRGGITNGVTSLNRASRFGTTSIVSTYPFIADDAATRALRGNASYAPADAARYAGLLLTHELGHQLFHVGHPYGRRACIMSPTPLLHFRQWAAGLAAKDCPLPGPGAMQPGVVKFPLD